MIESTRNPRIVAAAKLHKAKVRRDRGLMLLEGPHLLTAALDGGAEVETVFATQRDQLIERAEATGAEIVDVTDKVIGRLADTDKPRGPIAIVVQPEAARVATTDTVVLVGIRDPGNAGTLIRSAAAFGFQVVATAETVDLWSPKVLRAAAGAHFQTPIVTAVDSEELFRMDLTVVALLARSDDRPDPDPAAGPIALLVGNEAQGLPKRLVAKAATTLTIPTVNVESLNAAVAGSIAMFAVAQGR